MQYVIGGELTLLELREAHRAMLGRDLPMIPNIQQVVALLARQPLRFEYEINRCRGLAFEASATEIQDD